MKTSKKKLVLFGLGDLARIANLYFTRGKKYEVVGFTVDKSFITCEYFMGLPVIPFESVESVFSPDSHEMHVCVIYNGMNRLRAKKCKEAKDKGYKLASYISPDAYIDLTAKIGENAFIFEDNTIQPYVEIGNNVIMWSGNHCGHDSKIQDNVFVSSHVVISGHCNVGANCFLGVNSTLANGTAIGAESWISHGSVLSGNVPSHSMVMPQTRSAVTALNEEVLTKALEKARR